MSIPLGYFLIAWAVLLAVYGILVFLTLVQTLRHGLASPFTYASSFIFIAVIVIVVGGCGILFTNTDWKAEVNVVPSNISSTFFGDMETNALQDLQL